MKYEYNFEVLDDEILIMNLPKGIKLVEVSAFGDWILEEIHSVLNVEKDYGEVKWQHLWFKGNLKRMIPSPKK